jgi:FKBP-type peptidyl-prolyl cis-trans isomerase SlyD
VSGARLVVVTHVEKNLVTVDANHPLAGRALHFEVAIAAVWDATRQEVEHRQVHGAGRPRRR